MNLITNTNKQITLKTKDKEEIWDLSRDKNSDEGKKRR